MGRRRADRLEDGVGPVGLSELGFKGDRVTGLRRVHTKLEISLVVCALMMVACSADDEQSELVTVQAAAPTTAVPPTTSASTTTAAEVVDPPDIPALDDDSNERQPEVNAPESEADAEESEMEAVIDDLKADLEAELIDLEAAARGLDEILADSLMGACGAEAVLTDFLDAFIEASIVINFALGADDPLVVEYNAAVAMSGEDIPTEADMARIYAAIDALAADERTADVDWNAVRSAYAAAEELIDCMARVGLAPTTTDPESAEEVPAAASLYIHEALCRAAGYEWTNPDATTGTFCTG